jgi:hypothetical protein
MSSAACSYSAREVAASNPPARQAVKSARQALNRKPSHQVPSTVMAPLREEIVAAMRAGRNVAQTAKEYDASAFVPVELWLRNLERRVVAIELAMRRAGVAIACLLMTCVALEFIEAASGYSEPSVERAFRSRSRRSRRRRDDSAAIEAGEHEANLLRVEARAVAA